MTNFDEVAKLSRLDHRNTVNFVHQFFKIKRVTENVRKTLSDSSDEAIKEVQRLKALYLSQVFKEIEEKADKLICDIKQRNVDVEKEAQIIIKHLNELHEVIGSVKTEKQADEVKGKTRFTGGYI